MIPHERSLVKKFKERPFALIGVNSDDTSTKQGFSHYKKMADKLGVSWRSFQNEGNKPSVSETWQVSGWPTFYFIDHHGVIRNNRLLSHEETEQLLEKMLTAAESNTPLGGKDGQMEIFGASLKAPYSIRAKLESKRIVIDLKLKDGWYIDTKGLGKGAPLHITSSHPEILGELKLPKTRDGKIRGKVRLEQMLNPNNDQSAIGVTLHIGVCDANGCLPTRQIKMIGMR